ncbi:hypothetical protein [Inquilinus sp. CAU 1745]|uniref:hypothetical protein n=1 Tax=Inquilinus sp. CAU 1745 TaxID=3140369 RepID=UPI00325B8083
MLVIPAPEPESIDRRRLTGGEGMGAVPASVGTAWMLDQVQHDVVFFGHSRLDLESMGQRRFTGGEVPMSPRRPSTPYGCWIGVQHDGVQGRILIMTRSWSQHWPAGA